MDGNPVHCADVCLLFVRFSQILRLSHQEMEEYFTNAVKHCASEVKNRMSTELNKIQNLAEMIGNSGPLDGAKTVVFLESQESLSEYFRIGLILPDGMGYGRDVYGTDFSDREYFQEAKDGKANISDVLLNQATQTGSLTFAAPVYREGKVVAVLAAARKAQSYQDIMGRTLLDGKGYFYIIKSDGTPVILSSFAEGSLEMSNALDLLDNHDQGEKIQQEMIGWMIGLFCLIFLAEMLDIVAVSEGVNHRTGGIPEGNRMLAFPGVLFCNADAHSAI